MIQRIQSIYLLLAGLCTLACLFLPIGVLFGIDGKVAMGEAFGAWCNHFRLESLMMYCLFLMATVLPLLTIFLFKKRKLQIQLTTVAIAIIVIIYIFGAFIVFTTPKGIIFSFHIGEVLPLLSLLANATAIGAIKRDEALVRAADRIR